MDNKGYYFVKATDEFLVYDKNGFIISDLSKIVSSRGRSSMMRYDEFIEAIKRRQYNHLYGKLTKLITVIYANEIKETTPSEYIDWPKGFI